MQTLRVCMSTDKLQFTHILLVVGVVHINAIIIKTYLGMNRCVPSNRGFNCNDIHNIEAQLEKFAHHLGMSLCVLHLSMYMHQVMLYC